ncbi:MAG: hypothetical protein ACP5E9_10130 [Candidatus Methanospirareceae archaeon]
MVIGGQAVLLYGEPRLTRDIDITLGLGVEHLATLEALTGAVGLKRSSRRRRSSSREQWYCPP